MLQHFNSEGDVFLASSIDVASVLARLAEPQSGRRRTEREQQRLAASALQALFPVTAADSTGVQPGVSQVCGGRKLETTSYQQQLAPRTYPKLNGAIRRRRCECGVCAGCVDHAKWEERFQKFIDPTYYTARTIRHNSTLSAI